MMKKFKSKSLLYNPMDFILNRYGFMTPRSLKIDDNTLRVFGGVRDKDGVSQIYYVDLDPVNPNKILKKSASPIIDLGVGGTFDDNGMILGATIKVENQIRIYYIGFQKPEKVKFLAFSGLLVSDDNGDTFRRYQEFPVIDRANNSIFFRAIHSVLYEDGIFKVWYSAGSTWKNISGIDYPVYSIYYTESIDGIIFSIVDDCLCLSPQNSEYRIGAPRIYKTNNLYQMFYTYDTLKKEYRVGYAESIDGKNWTRKDNPFPLNETLESFDNNMQCYPDIHFADGKSFVFYNGNDMGKTGLLVAIYED